MQRKAILIQDVTGFLWEIEGVLRQHEVLFLMTYQERLAFFEWITLHCILERYEYDLFPPYCRRNYQFERYAALIGNSVDLLKLASFYIKLPVIYGENTDMTAGLHGTSLYIHYQGL